MNTVFVDKIDVMRFLLLFFFLNVHASSLPSHALEEISTKGIDAAKIEEQTKDYWKKYFKK